MPTPSLSKYAVAIIGGGPAGSSCAINLCRLGIKDVIMLESGEYDKFRIGESIPPETRVLFQQMGILEAFLAEKHDPCYGSVSYWGDERRGYNDFIMSPYGHGWHLDRRRFNHFMAKEARQAGATVLTNVRFNSSTKLNDQAFELTFSNNDHQEKRIIANIVVDASGSKAIFAGQRGSFKMEAMPIVCLAARFAANDGNHPVFQLTHLEAVKYGWWYTARLPDKSLLVTLYTDHETLQNERLNQSEQWLKQLMATPNTHQLVSDMELIDRLPKGFPAPSYCLNRVVGNNWIAIGDAATAYDPITAQGIIKSLTNGIESAGIVANYLQGNLPNLESFQHMINSRYQQYLDMRKHYYNLENRWPESKFWQKMQGKITAVDT